MNNLREFDQSNGDGTIILNFDYLISVQPYGDATKVVLSSASTSANGTAQAYYLKVDYLSLSNKILGSGRSILMEEELR